MIDLEPIWKAYKDGDHSTSLNLASEGLAKGGLDLLHIIGLSLVNLNRNVEGFLFLKAAASLRPTSSHIHVNASFLAEQCGLAELSGAFAEIGLIDFPDDPNLLLLMGNSLIVLLRFDEAEAMYRKLLEREPRHAGAMINLGNIARNRDDFATAEAWFSAAEAIEPDLRDLIFARATMYTQRGESGELVIPLLEKISDDIDAQFLLSLLYLARGDYERGFRLFRDRAKSTWYRNTGFVVPLKPFNHWAEAIGKRIAVIAEGGFGDDIQFCRYLPMIAEVADVTLYTAPKMLRLFRHNLSNLRVLEAANMKLDDYDYLTTDCEMPIHFLTTLDTIPDTIPYLSVPSDVIQANQLPPTTKKRVGLCWSGGERDRLNQRAYDVRRSFDLATYAPLGQVPNIEFVSLQVGARADQRCDDLFMPYHIRQDGDFMDTAGLIMQLDLVISVDTSVAHLAAALGKPVWLLSRHDCCWRWLNNRPDSPWYPGVLRVFGQKAYRDWSQPIAEVVEALQNFVGE